ncbi:unnamed protein product [Amoebophrya sp. A25]|nr:unnamed protein product [Amoebophrya sp. A25]|eukprot:GSA25T00024184001.1
MLLKFAAQYKLLKMKQEQYDREQEELERQAIEAATRLEQKRFERQAMKKVEEMRKKKEITKKKTEFFDACYDGEFEIAKKLLEKDPVLLLEATDNDGYAPLSAASNGGNVDLIQLLLDYGANPNARGEFHRTALWRAAFTGNTAAVDTLLNHGADPTFYDNSMQTPLAVAPADSACEAVLQEWTNNPEKREKTQALKEQVIEKMEAGRRKLGQLTRKQANERLEAVQTEIDLEEAQLAEAKRDASHRMREWSDKVTKRMMQAQFATMHGNAGGATPSSSSTSAPNDPSSITSQEEELYIREMASQLGLLKRKLEESVHRVEELKLKYQELQEELDPNAAGDSSRTSSKIKNLSVLPFKFLSDAVLRSAGPHAIVCYPRGGGTGSPWPLVWDTTGRAAVFFEYSGASTLKMWNYNDIRNMRRALLNCVRHDVPFVLDTLAAPIDSEHLSICLESLLPPRARARILGGTEEGADEKEIGNNALQVAAGLAPASSSKSKPEVEAKQQAAEVLRKEGILKLITTKRLFDEEDLLYNLLVDPAQDGAEFQKYEFAVDKKNFKFILLSSCETPDMDLMSKFHVVRVVANQSLGELL